MKRFAFVAAAWIGLSFGAEAAVLLHDEAVDGDHSDITNYIDSPEHFTFTLTAGETYTFLGSLDGYADDDIPGTLSPFDRADMFQINVPGPFTVDLTDVTGNPYGYFRRDGGSGYFSGGGGASGFEAGVSSDIFNGLGEMTAGKYAIGVSAIRTGIKHRYVMTINVAAAAVAPVPLPAGAGFLLAGLIGLGAVARRKAT